MNRKLSLMSLTVWAPCIVVTVGAVMAGCPLTVALLFGGAAGFAVLPLATYCHKEQWWKSRKYWDFQLGLLCMALIVIVAAVFILSTAAPAGASAPAFLHSKTHPAAGCVLRL